MKKIYFILTFFLMLNLSAAEQKELSDNVYCIAFYPVSSFSTYNRQAVCVSKNTKAQWFEYLSEEALELIGKGVKESEVSSRFRSEMATKKFKHITSIGHYDIFTNEANKEIPLQSSEVCIVRTGVIYTGEKELNCNSFSKLIISTYGEQKPAEILMQNGYQFRVSAKLSNGAIFKVYMK